MAGDRCDTRELRPLLFSLAYRMVGSVGEAEDLVQEAFLRLHAAPGESTAPKAFLTTVVTRLAIDHLRSARVRREAYVGPGCRSRWSPTPRPARPSGSRTTRRCRSRSWRCSSACRPSSAPSTCCTSCSATATTRSPRSSARAARTRRQILTRARRHVERAGRASSPSRREREALLGASSRPPARATSTGSSSCSRPTPSPTPTAAARRARRGCRSTARRRWRGCGPASATARGASRSRSVGPTSTASPGVIVSDPDGRVNTVLTLEVADGRVRSVWAVVNPDKLARVPAGGRLSRRRRSAAIVERRDRGVFLEAVADDRGVALGGQAAW